MRVKRHHKTPTSTPFWCRTRSKAQGVTHTRKTRTPGAQHVAGTGGGGAQPQVTRGAAGCAARTVPAFPPHVERRRAPREVYARPPRRQPGRVRVVVARTRRGSGGDGRRGDRK